MSSMSAAATETQQRVTNLELFFDLVFVFTITQLTSLLAHEPTFAGLLQVALIFGNVWWMYGGYAWLTNAVPPRELVVRLLLLIGMAAFLLVALSIPTTFTGGGIAFGVGYLVVNLVHTGVFLKTTQASVATAMTRLGPTNIATAAVLLVAGFTPPPVRLVLFAAGFVFHWLTPLFTGTGGFRIQAGHFVERHGLILLIAIGESVVAVGLGLGNEELPPGRILAAVLGLTLTAGLWWLYFNGDEERAEAAIDGAPQQHRPWLALNSFGYVFLLVLGGIVVLAAGMKLGIVHYGEPANLATAGFLAGGVAAYLVGLALFRWVLDSGPLAMRFALAALSLPTVLIGIVLSPIAQLIALVFVVAGGAAIDTYLTMRDRQ